MLPSLPSIYCKCSLLNICLLELAELSRDCLSSEERFLRPLRRFMKLVTLLLSKKSMLFKSCYRYCLLSMAANIEFLWLNLAFLRRRADCGILPPEEADFCETLDERDEAKDCFRANLRLCTICARIELGCTEDDLS